jgi:hypothetical protein
MPPRPQITLKVFDNCEVDFVGPINPPARISGARYIIATKKYLTQWDEAISVKYCSVETTTHFLFEHVITRFGCPRIMMSDQGTHFINSNIQAMNEEFEIYHQKSTPYHHQNNGTMEAFNNILEKTFTKICNVNKDDWDLKIPIILWNYRTTCKKLLGKTAFKLVYGQEAIIPLEYLIPILHIATITNMDKIGATQERLAQLMELKEDMIVDGFHQEVQKKRTNLGMIDTLRRIFLRKEICFSSMKTNAYNTQGNS